MKPDCWKRPNARRFIPGGNQVDFEQVRRSKEALLGLAYRRFSHDTSQFEEMQQEFWDFSITESAWLDDYALFMILKEEFNGACWNQWPEAYRHAIQELC